MKPKTPSTPVATRGRGRAARGKAKKEEEPEEEPEEEEEDNEESEEEEDIDDEEEDIDDDEEEDEEEEELNQGPNAKPAKKFTVCNKHMHACTYIYIYINKLNVFLFPVWGIRCVEN